MAVFLKIYHNVTDRQRDRQTHIPINAFSRADAR